MRSETRTLNPDDVWLEARVEDRLAILQRLTGKRPPDVIVGPDGEASPQLVAFCEENGLSLRDLLELTLHGWHRLLKGRFQWFDAKAYREIEARRGGAWQLTETRRSR